MYKIGDLIVYGSTGVCVVEEIGSRDIPGMNSERVYYTLRPYYEKKSTIFTPVDNARVVMRPVIGKDEAMKLIDEIPSIGEMDIKDEKQRETIYKACFLSCDCREVVRMIHTITKRIEERVAVGKRPTAKDERYLKMAEDNLYGELALAFDMDKAAVKDFVRERIGA